MSRFVIGAGRHSKVVLSTLKAAGIVVDALLVDIPSKWGSKVLGIEAIGGVAEYEGQGHEAIVAVGNNSGRQSIAARNGFRWFSAVHPSAVIDPTVQVGEGSMIFAGVVVQPEAVIGSHVILNTSCSVDHECRIGAFAHIAPGVHLAGAVQVEEGAFLGCGSVAIPDLKIGAWSVIGAGAVVLRDVDPGVTVVGCPAKPLVK